MKLITSWEIKIVWEDGKQESIVDVPKYVAEPIDEWLGHLEQERS